jgi:GNAT superfamily N-acetyltransferase
MSGLTIRDMEKGEEFSEWFSELLVREEEERGLELHRQERYLVLTNEIGDWIGGARYSVCGGVAQLLDMAIAPEERNRGYGRALLEAFEERANEADAHLAEFWIEDLTAEPVLAALGWRRLMSRENYIGHHTWYLMEKNLAARG